MSRIFKSFAASAAITACLSTAALAQVQTQTQTEVPAPQNELSQQERYQAYLKEKSAGQIANAAAPGQERCITIMSSFPNSGDLPRYQFFKLSQDLAVDTTPQFRAALTQFGEADVSDSTPILDVVETIANPVLRQAAPEIVVANMAHIIGFAQDCGPFIDGQIQSLRAVDNSLSLDDIVIAEDALYLRQVLSESLSRLGGESDPVHGTAVRAYSRSLIVSRDAIEFAGFDNDIDDLEALYLTDLDGRLARSNEIINSEINRETLGDAVQLSKDISATANQQEKARSLNTLLRILGGGI